MTEQTGMAASEYNPPGAPTVMTTNTISKLDTAFSYGATDEEAAFYAGIAVSTLYNYCRENPSYRERKERLKEQHFMIARETMIKALKDDPKFALDYMKAKRKSEFGSRTELTGANGAPLETGHEYLKQIAEALTNADPDEQPEDAATAERVSEEAS